MFVRYSVGMSPLIFVIVKDHAVVGKVESPGSLFPSNSVELFLLEPVKFAESDDCGVIPCGNVAMFSMFAAMCTIFFFFFKEMINLT